MAIGTTIRIKLDSSAVARGFAKIKTGFSRLGSSVAKAGRLMMAPFMKLQVMLAPLLAGVGGFMLFKNASKQAADMESFATAFEQLLGSMDLAAKRMTELEKFSTVTPFEPEEVIKASKMLQSLGGDMLATGRGLRMVGDAAAVANQPLEEVALHIGRLYGAVTSGTSAGESVNRLLELGLMTGTAKRGFENLAAAQKKGTIEAFSNVKAMSLLTKVLGKTDGAMEKLSKTFAGRISTLKGNWNALLAAMGKGLNIGLGEWVDMLNNRLPKLTNDFIDFGKRLGKIFSGALNIFNKGETWKGLITGLKYVAAEFGNFLMLAMDFAVTNMIAKLGKTELGKKLGIGGDPNFRTVYAPDGTRMIQGSYGKTMIDTPMNRAAMGGEGMSWRTAQRNQLDTFGAKDLLIQLKKLSEPERLPGYASWQKEQKAIKVLEKIARNTQASPAF